MTDIEKAMRSLHAFQSYCSFRSLLLPVVLVLDFQLRFSLHRHTRHQTMHQHHGQKKEDLEYLKLALKRL